VITATVIVYGCEHTTLYTEDVPPEIVEAGKWAAIQTGGAVELREPRRVKRQR